MPSMPRVTVITPNLNEDHYLEQTLCSILDQGYENVEYFVTDGGSTDRSIELVRLYEGGVSCWRSGPDAGPGSAINWALSRASGELVVILPSHDLLLPGALETASAYFHASDTADWLVGDAQAIGPADEPLGPMADSPMRQVDGSDEQQSVLARTDVGMAPLAACCFRRQLFEKFGPLSESRQVNYAANWMQRLFHAGHRPTRTGTTLAAVREHSSHPPTEGAAQPSVQINLEVCRGLAGQAKRRAA